MPTGEARRMSRRIPIAAAAEAYRYDELRLAGVSRDRLRASDIRRFGRGFLLHPDCRLDLADYRDRCVAVGQVLRPEHFVSRRSAARLLDIPCPLPPGECVEVGAFAPARPPRRPQVLGHRVRPGALEWTERAGLVLPSPADVWCQLAAVLGLKDLVVAGDDLLTGRLVPNSGGHRRPPLATLDDLSRAAGRHRGSSGTKLRGPALSLLRAPVDSPKETELRLLIVNAGFTEPEVHCPVPVIGRTLHSDLGYPDLKIAIEYDGAYHFDSPQQVKHDAKRRALMEDAGWKILHVMVEDLRDPRVFLRRLTAALRERGGL